MKPILFTLFLATGSSVALSQHLLPVKLSNCATSSFCLDCGEVKAGYDKDRFAELLKTVAAQNKLLMKQLKGSVNFQVLVDSAGKGCVLSHSDRETLPLTLDLVEAFNAFTGWTPAMNARGAESRSSITLQVEIGGGKLSAKIQRMTEQVITSIFDRPVDPRVANTRYVYPSRQRSVYSFTVYNSKNSPIANNLSSHLAVDQDDVLWYQTAEGLYRVAGGEIRKVERKPPSASKGPFFDAITVDHRNVKWMLTETGVTSFDGTTWTSYDSVTTGVHFGYAAVANPGTQDLFFPTDHGLAVYRNAVWTFITRESLPALPSNKVRFAQKDAQNRTWIGTYSGSIMLDENNRLSTFTDEKDVLKGKCITSMTQDREGNLYFGLYDNEPESGDKGQRNGGIAVRSADGTWKHLTTGNSGLPVNETEDLLWDDREKVLWIATSLAGLARYDPARDEWALYHNKNSGLPTSFVCELAMDSKGRLCLSTRYGLVVMERK